MPALEGRAFAIVLGTVGDVPHGLRGTMPTLANRDAHR